MLPMTLGRSPLRLRSLDALSVVQPLRVGLADTGGDSGRRVNGYRSSIRRASSPDQARRPYTGEMTNTHEPTSGSCVGPEVLTRCYLAVVVDADAAD